MIKKQIIFFTINKFFQKICLFLLSVYLFVLSPVFGQELPFNEEIKQVKHDFWIEFVKEGSNTDYELTQLELLTGTINEPSAPIEVQGNLTLRSRVSASLCQVALPSSFVDALNQQSEINQTIRLSLDGKIGDKKLTTDFINPNFDEYNQAHFSLQLFVEPSSLTQGLPAGIYDYQNGLKLSIEFQDK